MTADEMYMHRCLQLARLGAGYVAPNPMVGAVLVHGNRVIGEGYHQRYGEAHAEVMCLASVSTEDRARIPESTMYVSLEPCAHFGKTPPCADRLVAERVARVVIGCSDPFAQVNGKGVGKLEAAGIPVSLGILEQEARVLNRRFFTYHQQQRPYVVLKWAQSADGFIGKAGERTAISHAATNRLVHRWRSEEAAILVGSRTASIDNPRLDTRLWPGPAPVRVLLDRQLQVPATHHLFDGLQPTLVLNSQRSETIGKLTYLTLPGQLPVVAEILQALYQQGLQSVLVEGGAQLLQCFIDGGVWDEARVITNTHLMLGNGLQAPVLPSALNAETTMNADGDEIAVLYR